MLQSDVPVGLATDATSGREATTHRVSLYWSPLERLSVGMGVCEDNILERGNALRLWTVGSSWFSKRDGTQGRRKGRSILRIWLFSIKDYFSDWTKKSRTSHRTTIVNGRIVMGSDSFQQYGSADPRPRLTGPCE